MCVLVMYDTTDFHFDAIPSKTKGDIAHTDTFRTEL